jgi:protoheme IX farnesyltransferase
MKIVAMQTPPTSLVLPRTRFADYLELTKPRIAVLVLFTVATGAMLAGGGAVHLPALLHTLFGTALVAAGASALNQLLERQSDALMRRTENRPLPAGRLHPLEVFVFGCGLGLAGAAYLAVTLQRPLAAGVAAITFLSYVWIYTPLKRRTPLNTLVGAVPGALPPVIGWTAVRGSLDPEVMALFFIIFLWQVPHFLAIAWIYRDDYARARLRMLPVMDRDGTRTGRHMLTYCLALLPASLAPTLFGGAGAVYLTGAILLGLGFLASAVGFARARSNSQARRVLRASLVYLPALLALLVLDGLMGSPAWGMWK